VTNTTLLGYFNKNRALINRVVLNGEFYYLAEYE